MERGPVALFGAIVAVGLGPALWLGAQFGRFDVAPPGPPVPVDRTHDATTQLMGGSGGGENQLGDGNTNSPVRVKPRAHTEPLAVSPSATPSSRPTDIPSTSPSHGSSAPSDGPSATPSESTGPIESGGGNGDGSSPPSSPAGESSSPSGGDNGGTGDGSPRTQIQAEGSTAHH